MKYNVPAILLAVFLSFSLAWPIAWRENYHKLVGRADTTTTGAHFDQGPDKTDSYDFSTTGGMIVLGTAPSKTYDTKAGGTDSSPSTTDGNVSDDTSIPVISIYDSTDSGDNKKTTSTEKSKGTTTITGKNATTTSKKTSSTKTQPTSVDPQLPAGGIAMVTPVTTEPTYIKIGQDATFSWSYTSLLISPTALNIEAKCSANSDIYTLTTNHSINDKQFVWDTTEFQANQSVELLTSKYTLYIYDADSNISQVASAGRLAVFNYPFGMYRPQPYTPWPQDDTYVNGVDKTTAKWLVAMGTITLLTVLQLVVS